MQQLREGEGEGGDVDALNDWERSIIPRIGVLNFLGMDTLNFFYQLLTRTPYDERPALQIERIGFYSLSLLHYLAYHIVFFGGLAAHARLCIAIMHFSFVSFIRLFLGFPFCFTNSIYWKDLYCVVFRFASKLYSETTTNDFLFAFLVSSFRLLILGSLAFN